MAERSIEPLPHLPTLRQRVYQALVDLIADGTLAPGQHLVETELADRLGVSRGPVREALQQLQHDGWVDLRPRHGAFVHQPSAADVDDFFDIRGLLEVESARLAAAKASPQAVDALRAAVVQGRRTLDDGDERAGADAVVAFHAQLASIASNRVLEEMLDLLGRRTRWYFAPLVKQRGTQAWSEHAAIVEAVAGGDVELVGELMRAHTEATRAAYKALQGNRGQRRSTHH